MNNLNDFQWPPPPKTAKCYIKPNISEIFLINKTLDIGLGILLAVVLNFLITSAFTFFLASHLPGYGMNPNPLSTIDAPLYYGLWFILSTLNIVVYLLIPKQVKSLISAYVVTDLLCLLVCLTFVSSTHQLLR